MRDKVSISRVQLLHPKIRDEVKWLIEKAELGLPPDLAIRVVQGFRTFAEQDILYSLGRTKVNPDGKTASKPLGNIVTNARGGYSYHNYGLSIDFAILEDKDNNSTYDELSWDIKRDKDKDGTADWLEVVNMFESSGYIWGGKWSSIKDYPHLQKIFGYKETQLLEKYNKKQFITGTQYVNI